MIFVSDDIPAKIPQKLNYESKKIQILGENGINFKLKHRKLITRFFNGDLVTRSGVTRRSVLYPEELASTQLIALLSDPLCFLADLPPILPCQPSLVSMHTLFTGLPDSQSWERKKVMRFPKFPRRESPVN